MIEPEGVAAPLEPSPENRCSFCHKEPKLVDYIITSPINYSPASICNECVNICESILIERGNKRTPVEPIKPLTARQFLLSRKGYSGRYTVLTNLKKLCVDLEAYAAAVSKNLTDMLNSSDAGHTVTAKKLIAAKSRILELEKEITALRETK